MYHENGVAGRDHVDFQRWGVAPSMAFGLGTPTRVTLSYFHQRDQNTPDFGVPVSRGSGGSRMRGIGRDFWGQLANADTEKTTVDSATLLLEHDFSDKASIRN